MTRGGRGGLQTCPSLLRAVFGLREVFYRKPILARKRAHKLYRCSSANREFAGEAGYAGDTRLYPREAKGSPSCLAAKRAPSHLAQWQSVRLLIEWFQVRVLGWERGANGFDGSQDPQGYGSEPSSILGRSTIPRTSVWPRPSAMTPGKRT